MSVKKKKREELIWEQNNDIGNVHHHCFVNEYVLWKAMCQSYRSLM